MSVVSTILRGVQDGPGVGVVGSAADADRQALSGDRSDLPGRSPHGASASVSGEDLADRDVLERLAQCFPSPATCWRVCSKRRGLWASVRWMARRRSTGPKPLQTGPLRRPNKGHSNCGKGSKIMAQTNGDARPTAATVCSSTEIIPVIADRAYNTDNLRSQLRTVGWHLVSPHRRLLEHYEN